MDKIDRYKILIRHAVNTGVAVSQKDFGRKLGYTNESSFSQIINEKVAEPKDFIQRICALIPNLNSEWLITGTGEMLNTENKDSGKMPPIIEDDFQRSILGAISAVEKIAESNRVLAESNHDLTITNKILATSNTELVQKLAGLLDEIRDIRSTVKYPAADGVKGQIASDVEVSYDKNTK